MRKVLYLSLILLTLGAVVTSGSRAMNADKNALTGDYVEARTASVFAGACHYNGELTTTGRDAIMAWKVNSGIWNGVDLAGVRALAVVTSNVNLAERATHHSELIIGDGATHEQTVAMVNALKSKYADSLGEVIAVKSAPLSFLKEGNSYSVSATGIAKMDIEAMPDDLCCKMPQLVWYQPLVSLNQRKVGYTRKASFSGDVLSDAWERSGENGAFYGTFTY